jgi:hypothetical protein
LSILKNVVTNRGVLRRMFLAGVRAKIRARAIIRASLAGKQ